MPPSKGSWKEGLSLASLNAYRENFFLAMAPMACGIVVPWPGINVCHLYLLPSRRYTGDAGLIPGLGRSPGEGNGNPLQYSCLGNPMNRGAWWATFQGVINELDMTEWLNGNNSCDGCSVDRQGKSLQFLNMSSFLYIRNLSSGNSGSIMGISNVDSM